LSDRLFPLEYAIAWEVFGLERPELPAMAYTFEAVRGVADAVACGGGLEARAPSDLRSLSRCDTILVPGWPMDQETPEDLVRALNRAANKGVRVASFCSGAFLLAEAGLLDGRRATTHWRYAAAFRSRFPEVILEEDRLFVVEGLVFTAAGSAAAIDLCMHLVREDHGADVANAVARRLVTAPVRDGGQAQFIEAPVAVSRGNERLAGVIQGLPARLDQPLTVAGLAREAAMSERSFIRHFGSATGSTPGRHIAGLRVRRAQELLETTTMPVSEVARQCGFETDSAFRTRFRAVVGVPPGTYRARFTAAPGQ
jgi:AraC family transcriptional activator FtrA